MFRTAFQSLDDITRTLFIFIIKMYRILISPIFGNCCRFHPTCSCYAEIAIRRFGIFKGACLVLYRLLRCHPYHPGGYDPVPEKGKS